MRYNQSELMGKNNHKLCIAQRLLSNPKILRNKYMGEKYRKFYKSHIVHFS